MLDSSQIPLAKRTLSDSLYVKAKQYLQHNGIKTEKGDCLITILRICNSAYKVLMRLSGNEISIFEVESISYEDLTDSSRDTNDIATIPRYITNEQLLAEDCMNRFISGLVENGLGYVMQSDGKSDDAENICCGAEDDFVHMKRISLETYEKALRLLKKVGNHEPEINESAYTYRLTITGGADDGLTIDALLIICESVITIFKIWEFVYNSKKGMLAIRNMDGETGEYAKELSQKYMSAFLAILENVDIDSLKPDIVLTRDLIQKIEGEIDDTVNPNVIDAAEALKYARIEIIEWALVILRRYFDMLDQRANIGAYFATYNKLANVFEIALPDKDIRGHIPLVQVVAYKWANKCSFEKALCECAIQLLTLYAS